MKIAKKTSHWAMSILTALSAVSTHAQAQAQVERPPQFVLLAYDGSYNNKVWSESRSFSLGQRNQGIDWGQRREG